MTNTHRLTITLSFAFFLFFSCSAPEPIDPPSITLTREDDTIHILGTFHKMTEAMYSEITSRGIAAEYFFDTATMFFSEAGGDPMTRAEFEQLQKLRTGDGAGRPSVEDLLSLWDAPMREEFQNLVNDYPLLDHTGRQATLYASRPHYAVDFLETDLIPRAWGMPVNFSIDSIYKTMAKERGFADNALDDQLMIWELKDTLADDDAFMEYLFCMLRFPMQREQIEADRLEKLQLYADSWSSGKLIRIEDYDFEHDDRAWNELDAELRAVLNNFSSSWLWKPREERWVSVIDQNLLENPGPQTLVLAVGYGHLMSPPSEFIPLLVADSWVVEQQRFEITESAKEQ